MPSTLTLNLPAGIQLPATLVGQMVTVTVKVEDENQIEVEVENEAADNEANDTNDDNDANDANDNDTDEDGGGGNGGMPRIFVRIHFPRWTGEVRAG